MSLSSVRVRNFRSIEDSGDIRLGPITVLIGRNNSGKTALLRAIYVLQASVTSEPPDLRLRAATGSVEYRFDEDPPAFVRRTTPPDLGIADVVVKCAFGPDTTKVSLNWMTPSAGAGERPIDAPPSIRPDHYFVPILARRRSAAYEQSVASSMALSVDPSDSTLTSRIAALSAGGHTAGEFYRQRVQRMFGFTVGTFLTGKGQQPGVALSPVEGLALDRMGEGIGAALRLVSELADSKNKLFLIEEPENDLHPDALRHLLDYIVEASGENQFVVSTHSDLVLRYLGGSPGACVYETVAGLADGVPASTVQAVESREQRLHVLSDLGYEADLPDGWLLFEESTAERVCRQILIPHFAPRLVGLRTIGASGASRVPTMFEDLQRVMLFAHLSERYRNSSWTVVDGDPAGIDALDKLKRRFRAWPDGRFLTFDKPSFEDYYPDRFAAERERSADKSLDWTERQKIKGNLAEDLCRWASEEPRSALPELEQSAAGAIAVLRRIEADLVEQDIKRGH